MNGTTGMRHSLKALLAAMVLAAAIVAGGCGDSDDQQDAALTEADSLDLEEAPSEKEDVRGLSSDVLRETVTQLDDGEEPPDGIEASGADVLVEVVVQRGEQAAASEEVEQAGGDLDGSAGKSVLLAEVPFDELLALERSPEVLYLRPPLPVNLPEQPGPEESGSDQSGSQTGAHLGKTKADAWHAAGLTGAGVKIGIIDSFKKSTWDAAQAAGDVPAPAGTFCSAASPGTCPGGNIWAGGDHGVGVAEVIHDQAPGAQIYLATADAFGANLQAVVDWFAQQGVSIISRSQAAAYDGAGNGTGAIARVVDSAVARGMTWFNSAGNSAGRSGRAAYYRGTWKDADGDRYMDFAPGKELLRFKCGYLSGVRWSDWGQNATDYDVEFYTVAASPVKIATAGSYQAYGAPPMERLATTYLSGCPSDTSQELYMAIKFDSRYPGNGTAGDTFEFFSNQGWVESGYGSNAYSATQPAADSANPGALAVGAIEPANGATIAWYSSEGPTNDGRMKPDLSAASCFTGIAYPDPNDCFNGTSAATPVAAGTGALVLQAGLASTPEQLKNYLVGATVDRGAGGPDNVYGVGELVLPSPPQQGGGGGSECDHLANKVAAARNKLKHARKTNNASKVKRAKKAYKKAKKEYSDAGCG